MATTSFKQVSNNAKGTVASGELNNVTNPVTFDIGGGEGALFPETASGSFFVTVWDSSSYPDPGDDSNMEILLVTSRSTDEFTATRAQQDTSAVAHSGTPACALLLTEENISDLNTAVNTLETALAPGTIMMYGGATAPDGWLMCDGTAVDRTTYAGLFAIISTTYGVGNGTSTFNIPNFNNRMPIGAGGTYSRGNTGGATTADIAHTHTTGSTSISTSQMPSHYHSINPPATNSGYQSANHTHNTYTTWAFQGGGGGWNYVTGAPPDARGNATTSNSTSHIHATNIGSFNSSSSGSGGTHNHGNTGSSLSSSQSIMNPYLAVNYIIKT